MLSDPTVPFCAVSVSDPAHKLHGAQHRFIRAPLIKSGTPLTLTQTEFTMGLFRWLFSKACRVVFNRVDVNKDGYLEVREKGPGRALRSR